MASDTCPPLNTDYFSSEERQQVKNTTPGLLVKSTNKGLKTKYDVPNRKSQTEGKWCKISLLVVAHPAAVPCRAHEVQKTLSGGLWDGVGLDSTSIRHTRIRGGGGRAGSQQRWCRAGRGWMDGWMATHAEITTYYLQGGPLGPGVWGWCVSRSF